MASKPPSLDPNGCDSKLVGELYVHSDSLFHQRINFFLAVEALIFTGLTQIWDKPPARLIVAVFGLALTFLFWLANVNLSCKLQWLMDDYTERSNYFKSYRAVKQFTWVSTRILYTHIIPAVAAVAWVVIALSVLGC
jgi:hypothetical protein